MRQQAAVALGIGTKAIFAERAENAELWDVDGRLYVDFAAGISVNNTTHRHPKVMAAVAPQAERFTHTCFHVAPFAVRAVVLDRALGGRGPGHAPPPTARRRAGLISVLAAVTPPFTAAQLADGS